MSFFSERLRQIMNERKITQSELVALTGIPKSAISQYLDGKFKPRRDRIYVIARVLEISPAWLDGFTGERELSPAEEDIITAYRTDLKLKHEIDRLMSERNAVGVFRAAKSHDGKTSPSIESFSADRLQKLLDAPETDEDL